jgi:hypothetical protein
VKIRQIEVSFAIPVDVTDDEMQLLDGMIQRIAKRNQPEGFLHWCAEVGAKPRWSKTDARIFGLETDPDAPESGEPTFDDEVLYFATCCRERYEGEKP